MAKGKLRLTLSLMKRFLQILNEHALLKSKLPRESRIIYFQTLKKNNYEDVVPQKSIFQKTHRPLLKKLQNIKNIYILQETLQKREEKLFLIS